MAEKSTNKCTDAQHRCTLKCPTEGCSYVGEADSELGAKFKVIAHQAAKHSTKTHA